MEKTFNFVYITTNLINGKQYIGEHSTNNLNSKKTINYLGSGSLLNKKIIQYGKENFKREILEFFNTKQESYIAQSKYIKMYNTHISNGGYNMDWYGGHKPQYFSEKTKELLKLKRKGQWTGEKNPNYKGKLTSGKNNPNYGGKITGTPEMKKLLSSIKKLQYINDPTLKQKISRKGKKMPDSFGKNHSVKISGKNNPRYIEIPDNIIKNIKDDYQNGITSLIKLNKKYNLSNHLIKRALNLQN